MDPNKISIANEPNNVIVKQKASSSASFKVEAQSEYPLSTPSISADLGACLDPNTIRPLISPSVVEVLARKLREAGYPFINQLQKMNSWRPPKRLSSKKFKHKEQFTQKNSTRAAANIINNSSSLLLKQNDTQPVLIPAPNLVSVHNVEASMEKRLGKIAPAPSTLTIAPVSVEPKVVWPANIPAELQKKIAEQINPHVSSASKNVPLTAAVKTLQHKKGTIVNQGGRRVFTVKRITAAEFQKLTSKNLSAIKLQKQENQNNENNMLKARGAIFPNSNALIQPKLENALNLPQKNQLVAPNKLLALNHTSQLTQIQSMNLPALSIGIQQPISALQVTKVEIQGPTDSLPPPLHRIVPVTHTTTTTTTSEPCVSGILGNLISSEAPVPVPQMSTMLPTTATPLLPQLALQTTTTSVLQSTAQFVKPPLSYNVLIVLALKNSPSGCMTQTGIINFITRQFPYFRKAPVNWKNALLHNLKSNKCFVKHVIQPVDPSSDEIPTHLFSIEPNRFAKVDEALMGWMRREPEVLLKSMANPNHLDALVHGRKIDEDYRGEASEDGLLELKKELLDTEEMPQLTDCLRDNSMPNTRDVEMTNLNFINGNQPPMTVTDGQQEQQQACDDITIEEYKPDIVSAENMDMVFEEYKPDSGNFDEDTIIEYKPEVDGESHDATEYGESSAAVSSRPDAAAESENLTNTLIEDKIKKDENRGSEFDIESCLLTYAIEKSEA